MTEREDDDQALSDLAAIAPDERLAQEVLEIARQRTDNEGQPEPDDAAGTG